MAWMYADNYKAVLISSYLVAEIHTVTTNSYMVAERCDLDFMH